jgi:hypothetical protein
MLVLKLLLGGLLALMLIIVIPQGGNCAGRGVLLDLLLFIAMQGQAQSILDRIVLFSQIYKVLKIPIVLVCRYVSRAPMFQNC